MTCQNIHADCDDRHKVGFGDGELTAAMDRITLSLNLVPFSGK
eukprot:CAMPEP_0202815550 /NCGR_PEP_ID=MMETSP1389-20130828/6312_1 /ASSEMBLY_ACC=CAM_ASM_000865 /TAXON_ID=302021 /ORGANISM="Rhodomonas sp., Strain CCMP768" /LENGTH=42 /DNA_ID= /DNA_START= /DNA_END= /DNA_ORIENTATION=